jgi:hypothetical protein
VGGSLTLRQLFIIKDLHAKLPCELPFFQQLKTPLEVIIPTSAEIADWTSKYFLENQKRTAHVLAGPKRETWFSAETFVALSYAAKPLEDNEILPQFSCWGEQQFASVFAKVEADAGTPEGIRRKPDIVCYLPENGVEAIDTIVEIKLLLNDEKPGSVLEGEKGLKLQMQNARSLCPDAKVLGLVFLAAAPFISPATFDLAVKNAITEANRIFPASEGFSWVSGHEFACVFKNVPTDFHYPAMNVCLALGAVELRSVQDWFCTRLIGELKDSPGAAGIYL